MKKSQAGFTLIELVMVIVILGVLAAVAIPKFIDMRVDANTAAVASVAGSLSAASATNYAARTASLAANATANKGVAVANCSDVPLTLQSGVLPTGAGGTYSITAAAIAAGASATCTLTFTPTSGTAVTAAFTGIGIA